MAKTPLSGHDADLVALKKDLGILKWATAFTLGMVTALLIHAFVVPD